MLQTYTGENHSFSYIRVRNQTQNTFFAVTRINNVYIHLFDVLQVYFEMYQMSKYYIRNMYVWIGKTYMYVCVCVLNRYTVTYEAEIIKVYTIKKWFIKKKCDTSSLFLYSLSSTHFMRLSYRSLCIWNFWHF